MQRRDFLKQVAAGAAAASTATFSINAMGANDRVVLGFMGLGGRGNYLAKDFAQRDDVEIRYLADVDTRVFDRSLNAIKEINGQTPECVQDFRTMLDDPEVDGIVGALPDHWHALGTILACQAGKDMYVEKPASHSIWEGRKMIEAARKYKRVVQVGAQNRSAEYCQKAIEYINSGKLGDIHFVRVLNSKQRGAIGNKPNKEAPEGVDYDMWLGPAPMRPFNENHFHYAWHWFWNYSGGDIINDGVHQMDIGRWIIGQKHPKSVVSGGGIHYFHDAQETPDTHTASWDFDGLTLQFEQVLWAPYMKKTPYDLRDTDTLPNWPFSGTRIEVYGTKQIMFLSRHGGGWEAFDADGKSVTIEHGRFMKTTLAHIDNYIDCIRTRDMPNGDIEELHHSANLCHYANIAYRTGSRLLIDPDTEGFFGNAEANSLVKRDYREPWVVPEKV